MKPLPRARASTLRPGARDGRRLLSALLIVQLFVALLDARRAHASGGLTSFLQVLLAVRGEGTAFVGNATTSRLVRVTGLLDLSKPSRCGVDGAGSFVDVRHVVSLLSEKVRIEERRGGAQRGTTARRAFRLALNEALSPTAAKSWR